MRTTTVPGPTGVHAPRSAPRRSILLQITLTLALSLAALGALLFLVADRLITGELRRVELEQSARQADELRRFLDAAVSQVRGQVALVAADSDLVHSTLYHVRLRGEAKAAQEDVTRIATTLGFDRAALLHSDGSTIAAAPAETATVPGHPTGMDFPGGALARAVWAEGGLWVVGAAIVESEGQRLAQLRVARRVALSQREGDAGSAGLRFPLLAPSLDTAPNAAEHLIAVHAPDGTPVHLRMQANDHFTPIVDRATLTLAVIFMTGCVAAAALMALYLRRQIRPLAELVQAVSAVGRGDFDQRVRERGTGEVAGVIGAFNAMAQDLKRLRGMEQQLREQERVAAVGRLATRLAHDINNPLTVIKNAALMLRQRLQGDSEATEDIRLVVHHCDRCATILQNLLQFGRPLRMRIDEFDLGRFCDAVIDRTRIRIPAGTWRVVHGPRPLAMRADPQQLEQMLENLLNNAHEAAPDQPVELAYAMVGGNPVISVRDRGPGFSPEARSHLFELFYTTKASGAGLGLANAAAIARAHGAELIVENDGGAVVSVVFPASSAAA